MFDVLISNGTVIDGSNSPAIRADVAIRGDRIERIGDLRSAQARRVIDATGRTVVPGFVDVHNHSDAWLLKTSQFVSKTSQGFTTEVIMADGISYAPVDAHTAREWIYYLRALNGLRMSEYTGWQTLADYMRLLDGNNVQNSLTHIPYANVRALACGWGRANPDDYAMRRIIYEIEQGMEQGAVGLSTGLDYIAQCFSTTDELVEACRPLIQRQGLYVTHVRYKKGTLAGVQEAVEIGKRAGVPVHISHLKGNNDSEVQSLLKYIDEAAVHEVDFSFDVYPYVPSSTMLNYLLPYEVWENGPTAALHQLTLPHIREQFAWNLAQLDLDGMRIAWLPGKENSHYQGKLLSEYVADCGTAASDALCDLLIEENLAVLLVFFRGDDVHVEPFLAHDNYMLGSDGIYHAGPPADTSAVHPRQYGSATRLLGRVVRKGLLSLEQAVWKLSGYPAERFGLARRGQLREGWFADIVILDPSTVCDNATYDTPHQFSTGIEHVLVNGVCIFQHGQAIDDLSSPLPGRALKFKQE